MKSILKNVSFLFLLVVFGCSSPDNWSKRDEIFKRIKPPVFSEKTYNIVDFGAIGDGTTDCTENIKNAIVTCSDSGGGVVLVPEGTFLTGAIYLKSNVNLHIIKGATLLFSKDYKKYLPVVRTRFEGNDLMNYSPFIYSLDEENIAVTGKGTIDGNADTLTWWPWKANRKFGWNEGSPNQLSDRDSLLKMSDEHVPIEKRVFGEGHNLRPNFVQFINCKNILIDGITILRSPMWELNPILSSNITIKNVTITSPGPNNDGFDPESCKDVLVDSCFFKTGDDCIAIKSGREEDGRRDNTPSENIIIQNCEMQDGHGGVAIGSEISGGCRYVFVENCKMNSPDLDRALRIKTNSLRGGTIENIYMRNVQVGEVREAVLMINFYYEQGDAGNHVPIVRNVFMDNVTSQKSKYAFYIKGYKRSPVENIFITDCKFNDVSDDNVMDAVENLKLDNVTINNKEFNNTINKN